MPMRKPHCRSLRGAACRDELANRVLQLGCGCKLAVRVLRVCLCVCHVHDNALRV